MPRRDHRDPARGQLASSIQRRISTGLSVLASAAAHPRQSLPEVVIAGCQLCADAGQDRPELLAQDGRPQRELAAESGPSLTSKAGIRPPTLFTDAERAGRRHHEQLGIPIALDRSLLGVRVGRAGRECDHGVHRRGQPVPGLILLQPLRSAIAGEHPQGGGGLPPGRRRVGVAGQLLAYVTQFDIGIERGGQRGQPPLHRSLDLGELTAQPGTL